MKTKINLLLAISIIALVALGSCNSCDKDKCKDKIKPDSGKKLLSDKINSDIDALLDDYAHVSLGSGCGPCNIIQGADAKILKNAFITNVLKKPENDPKHYATLSIIDILTMMKENTSAPNLMLVAYPAWTPNPVGTADKMGLLFKAAFYDATNDQLQTSSTEYLYTFCPNMCPGSKKENNSSVKPK